MDSSFPILFDFDFDFDSPADIAKAVVASLIAYGILARLYRLLQRYRKWRALKVIPGPVSGFWLGQFPAIRKEPFMEPHKRWWKQLGNDAPLIRYNSLMGSNSLLLLDPALVKTVMMAPAGRDDCRFYKPIEFLPSILGYGLVTLEGQEWQKHRRIIQPAFSVSFLKAALNECVPPKAEAFVELWKSAAADAREIDAASHFSALTLDVIGEAAFSHDFKGIDDVETWAKDSSQANQQPALSDPFITAFTQLLTPSLLRVFFLVTGMGYLDRFLNSRTRRANTEMKKTVDSIVLNARDKLETPTNDALSTAKSKSLLQIMMSAQDPSITTDSKGPAFSESELRDELKTFVLAGHETTSTWCYWAMYALAKHPDVQEKLYTDIIQHAPSGRISLQNVEQMEYLHAFLQECLRMYPPVGMMMRTNRFEEKLAGYTIPPRTGIVIPIHLLHRHPKYWPNPETFQPERWLDMATSTAGGLDTKGFTFIPFGAGGHNCIGYRFATLEAQLIMATVVRALRVEIAPSQRDVKHEFTTFITMKAKPGLKIIVKERK